MNLSLCSSIADNYKSNSQKIRVLSEYWANNNIYCPSCGNSISKYKNNKPVADFYCLQCREDFELKSKKGKIGKKITDGAYSTMIKRLQSSENPNFFFLNYDNSLDIINFILIPKYFFTQEMIEKRKPLSSNAKRAGWIGCNILLNIIPQNGKIFYIRDKQIENKNKILESWHKTVFLKQIDSTNSKGWLLDIIRCIEKLGKQDFTLNDIYQFENYLKIKYPKNNNIKAKIRQQLQVLRDKNYLTFTARGKYSLR
jgi:type II restriction enzyme